MKRYWVSWVCNEEDYRPINYPPNENILGWWVSGQTDDGVTICALVQGDTDTATKAITKEWPEQDNYSVWRFFKSVADDYVPGDRFPITDWMKDRINV